MISKQEIPQVIDFIKSYPKGFSDYFFYVSFVNVGFVKGSHKAIEIMRENSDFAQKYG